MKPSRMKEHLSRVHSDKMNKDVSYFQELKAKAEKRPNVSKLFTKQVTDFDKGLLASYEVALLIAKCGKPHTIGETLVLPAAKKIVEIMFGEGSSKKISQSVPLSNNSVSRRIDEMAADVESKLTSMLKKNKFALQIDESTVIDNTAILLAYVRFINEQKDITEEMLFARSLITDAKGSSIFNVLIEYFKEKDIPLSNVSACATDGAPAMTGRHAGFLAHLKKEVPGVITIHCVIHRQHLAAKTLSGILHETLQLVINGVNKIKSSALNDRLFRQLCHENDEEFERLLLPKCDLESRFEDIANLHIPDWVFDPFSYDAVDTLDNLLQTDFLDLKYDCEAKMVFKQHGYELAWMKLKDSYPKLWEKVESLLISFPSTYLVEKGFSSVVQLLTKQRNKLDICTKGDLRLHLTNIQPDIQALTALHQAQGSH